ncbi:uncharacterized protein LOC141614069 [Silene latifolia]|uniref:uncharacterized protein LOC141614069 n=1 Tax=Silene latifolia TaxID=37657 RepID=UPI003D77BA93
MAASQSRCFNFIKDVNNTKETWRLKVRVIKLYDVPSWTNPKETSRIEMVFLDEKNDKIQASFKDKLIRQFRPLHHEGELYNISNFLVMENNDNHKSCYNNWKINFHNTFVRECAEIGLQIPKFGFEFVSFQDIQEQKLIPNIFIGLSSMSNSFHTSRLMRNPNSQDVAAFIASCGNLPEDNAQVIEELEVIRSLSIKGEFFKLSNRKYISDFLNIKEYSFISKSRFKVVFKVEDDTGKASFLLYCRKMVQLIGKTATNLLETLIKNREEELFPMELDDLLGKQFLFKVNISDFNVAKNYKVYNVTRITDDPELLTAHFALLKKEEVH